MESIEQLYDKFYRSIGFERKAVFAYLQKTYNPKTVLYPGSSIHITPSFYFQHVVYIDKSNLSQSFFANANDVKALIAQNQIGSGNHYFLYLNKDFSKDTGLQEHSFDMLISIFSGEQIGYCQQYLKEGGLVLTTSLFSDWNYVKESARYVLVDSFMIHNGKVKNFQGKQPRQKASKMKKSNGGFTYQDNETYYLYKKSVGKG